MCTDVSHFVIPDAPTERFALGTQRMTELRIGPWVPGSMLRIAPE
jgi:hypothetical protein